MTQQSERGFTLVEVLVATAVATTVLAGVAGLIGVSSRAVIESELDTMATWLASRTVEEWRGSTTMPAEGQRAFDREGREVGGNGVFIVRWAADVEPAPAGPDGLGRLWRVSASASSPRLRGVTTVTAVVVRMPA